MSNRFANFPLRSTLADLGPDWKECAEHKDFTVATDVKVYFCESAESLATRLEPRTPSVSYDNIPQDADLTDDLPVGPDKVAQRFQIDALDKLLGFRLLQ